MNNKVKTRRLCMCAVFIAISLILANIKVFQSIAFDSMPAFLAVILISPLAGGIVGVIGHFFTALLSGFPYTLPMHIIIMIEMFVVVYTMGIVYKKGHKILAVIIGIVLNGPISVVVSGVASGWLGVMPAIQFITVMIIPLTVASTLNVILAYVLGRILGNANIKI